MRPGTSSFHHLHPRHPPILARTLRHPNVTVNAGLYQPQLPPAPCDWKPRLLPPILPNPQRTSQLYQRTYQARLAQRDQNISKTISSSRRQSNRARPIVFVVLVADSKQVLGRIRTASATDETVFFVHRPSMIPHEREWLSDSDMDALVQQTA